MLKIQITSFERALAFQVKEQSESVENALPYTAANGVEIESLSYPELSLHDKIYLHGFVNLEDSSVCVSIYFTDDERDKALERFTEALFEFCYVHRIQYEFHINSTVYKSVLVQYQ